MYVDVDCYSKISIHDITASEALSIATILMNTPLCSCPAINQLGKRVLQKAYEAIENKDKEKQK